MIGYKITMIIKKTIGSPRYVITLNIARTVELELQKVSLNGKYIIKPTIKVAKNVIPIINKARFDK